MRIAIIGSGVSGLVAARRLHAAHDVTVFEADHRIGGHVHTWRLAGGRRAWAVDSGFIVYNAGVGAMFAMAALDASQPLIPWLVCVAHIGMAVAFAISLVRGQSAQTSAS